MSKWSESDWTEEALVGGHPALDFLNTAGGRTKARGVDRLVDYDALLRWSVVAGTVTKGEADFLRKAARENSSNAHVALTAACAFREALHACLMAEQAGGAWPPDAESEVLAAVRDAVGQATLLKQGDGFAWHISLDEGAFALPKLRIELAAESLLRSSELARMRNCDRCSWLFVDRGRGRPRRWCSMAACGSRAKSARYYRRKTGA